MKISLTLLRVYNSLKWKLFLVRYRLPLSLKHNSWSMHIQDFVNIFKYITDRGDLRVVELGGGLSTIILACMLSKSSQNSLLITLEGDEYYFKMIEKMILRYKLTKYVRIYHVPYRQYDGYSWFDKELIKKILENENLESEKIDILLVDAPPGGLCKYSRRPAIPFFLPYIKTNGIVILHDAKRQDEVQILKDWKHYFHECVIVDTPVGLAFLKSPKINLQWKN